MVSPYRDTTRDEVMGHDELPIHTARQVDVRLPGKGNSNCKLPWREAGPPSHHDDKVVRLIITMIKWI